MIMQKMQLDAYAATEHFVLCNSFC